MDAFIQAIGMFIGLILSLFWFFKDDDFHLRFKGKMWAVGVLPLLLCWIWGPWLCYGVYITARWNLNQINWIERPPVVEPADQEHIKATRQSAKDSQ